MHVRLAFRERRACGETDRQRDDEEDDRLANRAAVHHGVHAPDVRAIGLRELRLDIIAAWTTTS